MVNKGVKDHWVPWRYLIHAWLPGAKEWVLIGHSDDRDEAEEEAFAWNLRGWDAYVVGW